jgi:hypothetical protein
MLIQNGAGKSEGARIDRLGEQIGDRSRFPSFAARSIDASPITK